MVTTQCEKSYGLIMYIKDSISVGCVPPTCRPYMFRRLPLVSRYTGPMSRRRWGMQITCPGGVPYLVMYPVMHLMLPCPPPSRGQTDVCENIPFPTLRLRVVNKLVRTHVFENLNMWISFKMQTWDSKITVR